MFPPPIIYKLLFLHHFAITNYTIFLLLNHYIYVNIIMFILDKINNLISIKLLLLFKKHMKKRQQNMGKHHGI